MHTLFPYLLADAVRASLERAGEEPFMLFRAQNPEDWLDLGWLQDLLEAGEHREIPLIWEGERTLAPMDTLQTMTHLPDRESLRLHRTGMIVLRGDVLVASVLGTKADGVTKIFLVLGERKPGALPRFRKEYDLYARRRSREWPHIYVVGGDPLPRPSALDWNDLLVPEALRSDLRRQVDSFFDSAAAYARLRIPHRRGILLTGPPGNGKTTAIRIIASRRPEPFYIFSLTDEAERYQIDDAFDRASYDSPSILCFEDVDSLFKKDGTLSHFLNRMDGLHPLDGVLVLATTNHPDQLDSAITERPSRFDRIYVFDHPGEAERRLYLSRAFGSAFDERLVAWTDGFSLAQVKEVHVSACLDAVEQGREEPALDAARRAVDRLRGQKIELDRDWEQPNTIGFRNGQLRISAGPISEERPADS